MIHLRPITIDNWKECIQLTVAENQQDLIATNLYSIAEAQFYAQSKPQAIYNEADQMVGFVMYGRDAFSGKWKILRLMVDAAHQHCGYGRAAMMQIISEIERYPDGDEIIICYRNHNDVARKLYASLGFTEQNVDEFGKVTALRTVTQS